mmetsp:Transcript_21984/g.33563  ORF Transcript_21984/g.33563 Transcript_21984/m.33563 type:complete len:364 (+) Transcript_21984:132-1223(+)|eukprot:CAMPEP_0196806662 /NCGR_PEP_ID=MMETSP1362-20130617/6575_1 /TAXON_ID=163516 /ORGANISM="Leptocylindrus danicus, Strain CCMP1856" /LENGTH=363 /DNA_ID=CAMNT_0042180251 /DNA_START=48 /DNA_END=1139 /DNA_ORIENTATION=+
MGNHQVSSSQKLGVDNSAHAKDTSNKTEKKKITSYKTEQKCGIINTFAVLVWIGWMGTIVYASVILFILYMNCSEDACVVNYHALRFCCTAWTTVCAISIAFPRSFPGERLYQYPAKWIMSCAEEYFGLQTVFEDEDAIRDSDKAIIFALEPHDMLPFSVFAFSPYLKRVPGKEVSALMTSVVFALPFIKQVYTWVGGNPVDKKTFLSRLGNNLAVSFVPGGVQEVTMMDPNKPDEILLFLKKRKGFIKIALQTGSPIVPVFNFGLIGSYKYFLPRGKLMSKFARFIGFLPVIFWGRFGIPMGIPNPNVQTLVFGEVIQVPKEEQPTQESIDKYHALVVDEMGKLFERHKEQYGYSDRTLRIV